MGLQSEQQTERPAGHLGVALRPVAARLERFGQQHLPLARIILYLVHAERDGAPDLGGQLAHPRHLDRSLDHVLTVGPGGRQLEDTGPGVAQGIAQCEDPGPEFPEGAADTEQLVLGGKGARDRLAVHGPVAQHPGGRDPKCARLDGLADDGAHLRDVVGCGRLVAGSRSPMT